MKKIILLGLIMLVLITACTESPTGNAVAGEQELRLQVDIPCPGHASLITQELYTVDGVIDVKYMLPDLYDVTYNPSKTNEEEIKSLEIFNEYACKTV